MNGKEFEGKCETLEKSLSEAKSHDIEAVELEIKLKLLSGKSNNLTGDNRPETVLKWVYNYNLEELFQMLYNTQNSSHITRIPCYRRNNTSKL